MRVDPQAGEEIDRSASMPFSWNGKQFIGLQGDTIASAMAANGVKVFSRSKKYNRPRGILTADYWDPNLFVQVGDEPNVRAGHRRLEPGLNITVQRPWPAPNTDVRALGAKLGKFSSPSFKHKTLPGPLQPIYENVVVSFNPGGSVNVNSPRVYGDKRFVHPDVLVVGGGLAGISAAVAAADSGASVLIVEHEYRLGGQLRWGNSTEQALLVDLANAVASQPNIEVLLDSTVIGNYADNFIGIVQRSHPNAGERLIKARAKSLVIASGLMERPYVFSGNDTPGVMTSTAARRLIKLHAIKPGTQAVVMTANSSGDAAIEDLISVGVEVLEVVDGRKGEKISAVSGNEKAMSVAIRDGRKVDADLCVVAAGWTATTSLLAFPADRTAYDTRAARSFPLEQPENVLVAGNLQGDGSAEQLIEHAVTTGRLAAHRARAVARSQMLAVPRTGWIDGTKVPPRSDNRVLLGRDAHPQLFRSDTHGFVDFTEDITSQDLMDAAAEGFDTMELLRRYTGVAHGSGQGSLSLVNTMSVLAEARGEKLSDIAAEPKCPPIVPVTLSALAGRPHNPLRRSPMHRWHVAKSATVENTGDWVVPSHYGDPRLEVRTVRTGVGLMDTTATTRIELYGPDCLDFLNLLYTNSWDDFAVGSLRYGLMCSDDGVVLAQAVTARQGANRFLMTVLDKPADEVWEWVQNCRQTRAAHLRVHLVSVTDSYAAMTIVGQKARLALRQLVNNFDVEGELLGLMKFRPAMVAGVPNCAIWRTGRLGELSYEILAPAGYGQHVWHAAMEAGRGFGMIPFGKEAERIMLLEKGQFTVGHDTDNLTKANMLGLDSIIDLDKPAFFGKPELASGKSPDQQLVSLMPAEPNEFVDAGTSIVRSQDVVVGRVTSSKYSPTLDRVICQGYVKTELATNGTELAGLTTDNRRVKVVVMGRRAFYDADGRLIRG